MDDMNDDILGLILERVDSHPSLIRAAATCKRWCRAVADAGFLRRYRSLHGLTVAGHYFDRCRSSASGGVEWPLFIPSSSSSIDDAGHFSLDFLLWEADPMFCLVLDSRGSLLLVDLSGYSRFGAFPDLAVCEPLTRRHVRIPAPGFKNDAYGSRFSWGVYLIDGIDVVDDATGARSISMSNFRVMCVFHRGAEVFAGGSTEESTWSEMGAEHIPWKLDPWMTIMARVGRAGGKWYFYVKGETTMVAVDGSTGELSSSALPPEAAAAAVAEVANNWNSSEHTCKFSITDGRDGRPRLVIAAAANGVMKVLSLLDGEWVPEKEVVLSEVANGLPGYNAFFFRDPVDIVTRGVGFVILSVGVNYTYTDPFTEFFSPTRRWIFSVDLETMEVKPADEGLGPMAYPCELPWPPALQACLHKECIYAGDS